MLARRIVSPSNPNPNPNPNPNFAYNPHHMQRLEAQAPRVHDAWLIEEEGCESSRGEYPTYPPIRHTSKATTHESGAA